MTRYKVTSATGYAGHKQGDEFDAELTPEQERRAKERGAIKAVKAKKDDKEGEKDA